MFQLGPGSRAAVPNQRVNGLAGDESATAIERNGIGVLPRDGKRKRLKTGFAQGAPAVGQEPCAESAAAVLLAHTDLGHVAHVFPHAGTKQQSGNLFTISVSQDARGGSVEQSAAWETDDVVQKSQRAGDRTVLIVDDAVQMPLVGVRNQVAGGGKITVSPGTQLLRIQSALRRPFEQACGAEFELHK